MIDIRHYQHHKLQYPQELTLVDADCYDEIWHRKNLVMVFISRKFLVQVYQESTEEYPTLYRLSVNRVKRNQHGWAENITWEELQQIKREIGYGDWFAVEIYPRDKDAVNVANMRHLWLFEKPLSVGWVKGER
jgi:hypothetical protein